MKIDGHLFKKEISKFQAFGASKLDTVNILFRMEGSNLAVASTSDVVCMKRITTITDENNELGLGNLTLSINAIALNKIIVDIVEGDQIDIKFKNSRNTYIMVIKTKEDTYSVICYSIAELNSNTIFECDSENKIPIIEEQEGMSFVCIDNFLNSISTSSAGGRSKSVIYSHKGKLKVLCANQYIIGIYETYNDVDDKQTGYSGIETDYHYIPNVLSNVRSYVGNNDLLSIYYDKRYLYLHAYDSSKKHILQVKALHRKNDILCKDSVKRMDKMIDIINDAPSLYKATIPPRELKKTIKHAQSMISNTANITLKGNFIPFRVMSKNEMLVDFVSSYGHYKKKFTDVEIDNIPDDYEKTTSMESKYLLNLNKNIIPIIIDTIMVLWSRGNLIIEHKLKDNSQYAIISNDKKHHIKYYMRLL